ncbi:hypothetical protein [Novosphingobium sp. 9]|uniref:hypothetical protein n=1 Tax=Novosphingobium sp. 9 TaxID=2025349 RepID=UPI0021B6A0BF|nr:hypothetical protein [Novosphingobium sp. 9]
MKKPDLNTPVLSEATRTPTTGVVSSIHGNPIETVKPEARPSEKVVAFVKDHPVALVAGGIAVGVLATALMPRGLRKRVASKAFSAAKAAGAAALTFGHDAEERAEDFGKTFSAHASRRARKLIDDSEDFREAAREHAEEYGSKAAQRVGKFGTALLASAKSFSKTTAHRAHDLADSLADDAAERGAEAMKRARAVRKAMSD